MDKYKAFLSAFLTFAALGSAGIGTGTRGASADEACAGDAPARFHVVVSSEATPENPDPELRRFALCSMVRSGKIPDAVKRLKSEKNNVVFREVLYAIGVAGDSAAGDFMREQCASPDAETAKIAYSFLPDFGVFDEAIYEQGMEHANAGVRLAAVEAACKAIPKTPALLAFVTKKIDSPDAVLSRVAMGVCLQFSASGARDVSAGAMNTRALEMAKRHPSRLPDILAGLLRRRVQPKGDFLETLLACDSVLLLKLVSVYDNFTDQLNSAFLRKVAKGTSDEAACKALALLSGRSSPKNDATLETLTAALSSGNVRRVEVVLNTFDTESEFFSFRLNNNLETANTLTANNDVYEGPGAMNFSLGAGFAADADAGAGARVRITTPVSPVSVIRFFIASEKLLSNPNFSEQLRNQAQFILLIQSRSARLTDIIRQLLERKEINIRRDAGRLSLMRYDDIRYVKLFLDAVAESSDPSVESFLAEAELQAPYFTLSGEHVERVLLFCAKNLISCADSERQILGLSLISRYGKPLHAEYVLPLCDSKSAAVRQSAIYCIARIAPEIYFLKIADFAADPDPAVRLTVPLACLKSGYRRVHNINPNIAFAQWAEPRPLPPGCGVTENIISLLKKSENDPDKKVRRYSRLALLEQGRLANAAALLRETDSGDDIRFAAQIAQSARIAKAENKNIPKELDGIGFLALPASKTPAGKKNRPEQNVVVFLRQEPQKHSRTGIALGAAKMFAENMCVRIAFLSDEIAREKLAKLEKIFPLSYAEKNKQILAFSAGGMFAGDTIDFADLCELGARADNVDFTALNNILSHEPVEDTGDEPPPLSLRRKVLLAGIAFGLLIVLAAAFFRISVIIRKRRFRALLKTI